MKWCQGDGGYCVSGGNDMVVVMRVKEKAEDAKNGERRWG